MPPGYHVQPFVVDFDNDMRGDLLGLSENKTLVGWSFNEERKQYETAPFNLTGACLPVPGHSSAFIDMDGDCRPDIVLHCDKLVQIWQNTREGFKLRQSITLPAGSGSLTFADMNGDGTTDIIFPICSSSLPSSWCHISILYNIQDPLCLSNPEVSCRNTKSLCEGDDGFRFNLEDTHTIMLDSVGKYLQENRQLNSKNPVRVGDIDNDGYPDLLISTNEKVAVLRSEPCTDDNCSISRMKQGVRNFVPIDKGIENLAIKELTGAVFFDLDEDGVLDIVASSAKGPVALLNNFYFDTFFLKSIGTYQSFGCDRLI